MTKSSLVPRLFSFGEGGEKEPGTHCLGIRAIPTTFQGSGYFRTLPCHDVVLLRAFAQDRTEKLSVAHHYCVLESGKSVQLS